MPNLNFPYAHFASRGATGDILFPLVWEAVHRLENGEIKVLCVTADGASTNRNDFGLHHDPRDRTSLYKTINHYALQSRHSSQVYANNVHCGELRTATSRCPFTPPMVH